MTLALALASNSSVRPSIHHCHTPPCLPACLRCRWGGRTRAHRRQSHQPPAAKQQHTSEVRRNAAETRVSSFMRQESRQRRSNSNTVWQATTHAHKKTTNRLRQSFTVPTDRQKKRRQMDSSCTTTRRQHKKTGYDHTTRMRRSKSHAYNVVIGAHTHTHDGRSANMCVRANKSAHLYGHSHTHRRVHVSVYMVTN